MITWLASYWRYLVCALIGLLLGVFAGRVSKPADPIHVEASQAQSGTLSNTAHFEIKPMPKLPNDPCPQLPQITVDCGGKVQGSQGQAVSATAGATQMPQFGLWAGLGATQKTVYGSAMLTYGKWSLTGAYGLNGAYGGDIKFKALEF